MRLNLHAIKRVLKAMETSPNKMISAEFLLEVFQEQSIKKRKGPVKVLFFRGCFYGFIITSEKFPFIKFTLEIPVPLVISKVP